MGGGLQFPSDARMAGTNIVIVGAGVAGLTTALLLSKRSKSNITIAAKHMPGDYDIAYASPWAGADFLPASKAGTEAAEFDRHTWPYFRELAESKPEAGVHFQKICIYIRKRDIGSPDGKFEDIWWKELFPDFQPIASNDLPADIESGFSFTSVCINTAIYLPWLVSQCLAAGIQLQRANFRHIADAASVHSSGQKADLVVNCTGLSSLELDGVEDKALFPIRGQIVLVRNNPGHGFSVSSSDDGPDESSYGMVRAAGGGTVIGGCSHVGSWDAEVDLELSKRILQRALKVCPELVQGTDAVIDDLDVIRHGVGLRPARNGGARIEAEVIQGIQIIHNYGHGGAGYQCSYGCAEKAVRLLEETERGPR